MLLHAGRRRLGSHRRSGAVGRRLTPRSLRDQLVTSPCSHQGIVRGLRMGTVACTRCSLAGGGSGAGRCTPGGLMLRLIDGHPTKAAGALVLAVFTGAGSTPRPTASTRRPIDYPHGQRSSLAWLPWAAASPACGSSTWHFTQARSGCCALDGAPSRESPDGTAGGGTLRSVPAGRIHGGEAVRADLRGAILTALMVATLRMRTATPRGRPALGVLIGLGLGLLALTATAYALSAQLWPVGCCSATTL
jgi:hypothetical protein